MLIQIEILLMVKELTRFCGSIPDYDIWMNPSIIIVEDDPFTAGLLAFLFEREQYQVTVLEDGQAAWQYFQKSDPTQFVLLDIMLPHVNGLELLHRLKGLKAWDHSKVVILSAKDQVSEIEKAFKLGADDYLTKPFDPQELMARVQRFH
jgi:DNA-binding response OmpR family regulator